jgi:uncharacterized membrane protein YqaE (UPF0057 family)
MANGVEKTDPIKLLLAFFIPPVGVAMEVGLGTQFWINLILTLLFWFPGMLHAFYIILTR